MKHISTNAHMAAYNELKKNRLTGDVPYLYGKMANLKEFYIGGNEISGVMPGEVCELEAFIETDCTVTCDCCGQCL